MSMKHLLTLVVCGGALMSPLPSAADYVIHLKNGRHIVTSDYWKREQTILFYVRGGIAGIKESAVRNIVEQDVARGREVEPQEAVKSLEASKATKLSVETVQSAEPAKPEKQPGHAPKRSLEDYKKQQEAIKSQIDTTLEKYREASSKQDEQAKHNIMQEISGLSKQVFAITDEVKQQNQGRLPEGWDQP